jgi:hypothetical protein
MERQPLPRRRRRFSICDAFEVCFVFLIDKVYDYVSSSELRTEPEYKDS